MDSTCGRLSCAVYAACAALLAGCGSTVSGHAVGSATVTAIRSVDAELSTLLPEPEQFPARYPAVVLPPEAAAQAAGDLTGVGRGASVLPGECAPPQQRVGVDRTAIAVGTDDGARATVTVELTRTDQLLAALRDQLRKCRSVLVDRAGVASTVTTELEAPPAAANDTVALRRTVVPEAGGAGLSRSMRSLIGQVGDVRITVAYMSFSDTAPDASAMDALFTTAVRKVRQG